MMEWLAMGGYGVYVWLSYALGVLVLLLNIWIPLRRHRRQANQYGILDG